MKMNTTCLLLLLAILSRTLAFLPTTPAETLGPYRKLSKTNLVRIQERKSNASFDQTASETCTLEEFVKKEYPSFHSLLSTNKGIWTTLSESDCTLFCPSEQAFENLGQKKLNQLRDVRNEEISQKMGLYHVVVTPVTAVQLRTEDWTVPKPKDGSPRPITVEGLITMGGTVPVGRKQTGANTDIVIGPHAKIVRSRNCMDNCMVHEMNALISPDILWRYCDQLRIPGF